MLRGSLQAQAANERRERLAGEGGDDAVKMVG